MTQKVFSALEKFRLYRCEASRVKAEIVRFVVNEAIARGFEGEEEFYGANMSFMYWFNVMPKTEDIEELTTAFWRM